MDLAPLPGRARKLPALPETLSVHETAILVRKTDAQVARQLRLGTFPARSFKLGRDWRVVRSDVELVAAEIDRLMAIEDGAEPLT
jgi:hypothetical protein